MSGHEGIWDSVDKIVKQYFASLTAQRFEYEGVVYDVPRLTVSPLLLREFVCHPFCGGCCRPFSLDYVPGEPRPPQGYEPRMIRFNGYDVPVFSDLQRDQKRTSNRCRNLSDPEGRCGIHAVRPFSCDFELIRFMYRGTTAHMSQRPFTRGWRMIRLDGGQGAMCEFEPPTRESVDDTIRKLGRFQVWADHFGITTRAGLIVDWIERIADDPLSADNLVLPGRSR